MTHQNIEAEAAHIIFRSGLINALGVTATAESRRIVDAAIDASGQVTWDAIYQVLPAQNLTWAPGDAGLKPVSPQGTITIVRAYCATAPDSGPATITITRVREFASEEVVATLRIAEGSQFAIDHPYAPVEANDWLKATVTDAQGASGVSIGVAVKARRR